MSDTVVHIENLGKKYVIGHQKQERYTALRDVIANGAKSWGRILMPAGKRISYPARKEFWALKDISFEVKQGDRLGIIGRNGAGKSTLLKVLSRITEPTTGQIAIKGRMASLLEVGTGFHPELTGKENIYLNGAIMGMSNAEIKKKFAEIVAFAEVEKFLDLPVKRYSSGMYVRLAFAVAAHLEPEILVVDEVLAVGDAQFQKKCLGKMEDVSKEGRTVLFVSHNMGTIRSLCSRAIWLSGGQLVMSGQPASVISAYLSSSMSDAGLAGEVVFTDQVVSVGEEMRLQSIRLVGPDGEIRSSFEVNTPIKIEVCYELMQALRGMRISLYLLTLQGEIAFITTDHKSRLVESAQPGRYKSICTIPGGLLNIGKYFVRVDGDIPGVKVLHLGKEYLSFTTEGIGNHGSDYPDANWDGVVCPRLDWQVVSDELNPQTQKS